MGLLAFHEEDAERFFGREEQTTRLWERFRDMHEPPLRGSDPLRLLPVLGPSGSGKSSVARAGLIPELARRPLPGWKDARVAVLTPGSRPLEALAAVLARIATGDSAPVSKTREFLEELQRVSDEGQHDGLRRIASSLPDIAASPLIVLVDQFEEVYSLCSDMDARGSFIENLFCAVTDSTANVSAIVTMRTDFLDETQKHAQLNSAFASQGVIIPAMTEDGLRRAIAEPAKLAGHPLDEATVDLLINETKDREGALPLLQFALTRIWDGLVGGVEPADTLKKIGGVGGALAGEAQRIYDNLPDAEKGIAKRVFLGLVQLGEGTRDTRRRTVVSSLVAVSEDPENVEDVIRRFSASGVRLITLSAEPDGSETAEVTHEALFEHWRKLDEWLASGRDDLRFQRRLDQAARHWEENEQAEGLLWRPPDLELLRQFQERVGDDLTPIQLDFFLASARAEKEREEQKAEQQRRLRRYLKTAVAAAAAGIILAIIASWMFFWARSQRDVAEKERDNAEAALATGFVRSMGHYSSEEPLNAVESNALWDLTIIDNERVRELFFQTALNEPVNSRHLRRRLEVAVHAAVGLSEERRRKVRDALLSKLNAADTDEFVKRVCVDIGLALRLKDEEFLRLAVSEMLARNQVSGSPSDDLLFVAENLSDYEVTEFVRKLIEMAEEQSDSQRSSYRDFIRLLLPLLERVNAAESKTLATTFGKQLFLSLNRRMSEQSVRSFLTRGTRDAVSSYVAIAPFLDLSERDNLSHLFAKLIADYTKAKKQALESDEYATNKTLEPFELSDFAHSLSLLRNASPTADTRELAHILIGVLVELKDSEYVRQQPDVFEDIAESFVVLEQDIEKTQMGKLSSSLIRLLGKYFKARESDSTLR